MEKNSMKEWTDEEICFALSERNGGRSYAAIGRLLGRSKHAVRSMVNKEKRTRRGWFVRLIKRLVGVK